ncbi:MAG: methionyl-tRNA formyltransferase, partial [Clostridia bacterium]|nr:methionyl-tRNA formyltransferase [Clostridia bacterium]
RPAQHGEILRADNILEIACGKGSIIIEKLQKAGSKQMIAKDFLLGNKLIVGSIIND